jgi:hypothetical protein
MRSHFLLVAFLLYVPAFAQTAALSGLIRDPRAAVISGAAVEVRQEATGRRFARTTAENGQYSFPALPPGSYAVAVSAPGFRPEEKQVELSVAARVTLDFELELEAVASSVEVTDTAVAVNRENASVGTLFNRTFVQNLPLNGRSFQSLMELTPGVVLAPASITNPGQFAVNGQRTNANYFLVDGVSGNVAASASATFTQQAAGTQPGLTILGGTNGLVSVDALEEFQVETSTYSAEYGRSPGAQVILLTRSGTNQWSGSVYNYFRNEKLDANDWFRNANGQARLPLRQNNFGGTFGGPLWRNRSFFFASYEGLRMLQPQANVASVVVPSELARSRAQGAVKAVFDAFPLPNAPLLPGDPADPNLARYQGGVSNPSQFDAFSIRGDHNFSERAQLFVRYNWSPSSTASRVFANQDNVNAVDLITVTGGLTATLSAKMVSETRVNFSDSTGAFNFVAREVGGAKLPPDELLFGANAPRDTSSVSLQLLPSPILLSLTQGRTFGNDQQQWNVLQTFSSFLSGHNLKFGFDYRLLQPKVRARSLSISHGFTTRLNSNGVTDLLETGRVNTTIQALAPVAGFRIQNWSIFLQDTWRVHPRLSLNYGLRWEFNPAPTGDALPYQLDQTEFLLRAKLAPPNTPLYQNTLGNFAPRFGLAWQLNDAADFVLRAGAGLFYDVGNGPALQGYTGFPFNSIRSLQGTAWPVPQELLTPAPFNQNPPYSAEFRVMDPFLKLPVTTQWNVSLEKAFAATNIFTVGYIGSLGNRLLRTEILTNRAGVGAPIIPILNPDLFGPASRVWLTRSLGESNYHSLQAQFQRRMTRGVQALASYTWAKAIDNVSDESAGGLPGQGIPGLDAALDREFGPASFDVGQVFTAAVTWQIPGAKANALAKALTSGWAVDGIARLRTAFPFHVIAAVTDPLNFASNRRADYLGGPPYIDDPNSPAGRRLNRAAFAIPAAGRQGTLGRNALRGFAAQQFDLGARRDFTLTERLRLQFKGEFFNILNRPNFGLPFNQLGAVVSPFFGQATQMLGRSLGGGGTSGGLSPLYQVGGPRSVQLSLRLYF